MTSRGLNALRELIATLRQPDAPLPTRAEMLARLEAIEAGKGGPRGRWTDLGPALAAMARLGSIKSSGDLGRALDPGLCDRAEKACALGGARLRQLIGEGWAVRHDLGGWSITDAGRAEAAKRAGEGASS